MMTLSPLQQPTFELTPLYSHHLSLEVAEGFGGVTGDQPRESAPSAEGTQDSTLALSRVEVVEGFRAAASSLRRIIQYSDKTFLSEIHSHSFVHLF